MTITEFLLARIAEDEDVARDCAASIGEHAVLEWTIWQKREVDGEMLEVRRTLAPYQPQRALGECEAKRHIVDGHPVGYATDTSRLECEGCVSYWPCPTLRALAAVYADHPDYQQEWAL